MNLILTKEQKAMRAYEARHSVAGQVAAFERVTRRALDNLSQDLAAEHGEPSFKAALSGLLNVLADHLAMLPDDDRKRLVQSVQAELPQQVETRVAMALKTEGQG